MLREDKLMEKEQLAIFGGTPVRAQDKRIAYGKQCIEEDDIRAVEEVLRSPFLTGGPNIEGVDADLCAVTGAKYSVVCSNGTAALHMACMAAGIGEGDEVIVSAITFAASANCVLYCGGTPVFADILPDTYNIDPKSVREKITSRTKAIVAVDYTGQATELDELRAICDEHNLILIEDAAHAIGTRYKGRPVGSIADITCFSFHPVKTVTSGEGGACTTNDPELYKRLHLLRSHGITRDMDEMVNKSDDPWYNEQVMLGYNYRMTDFQAALLRSQLKKLQRFSDRRKEIAARYDKAFGDMKEIFLQAQNPDSDTTRHLYVIRLNPEHISCTRREFFDAMVAEGTVPQVHYLPVYRHSYYEKLGYKKGLCPVAEATYEQILSIPFYPALTDEDVEDVIHVIKKIAAYYSK